jgi:DHA1 family bicyclomycin/chloramphenicol resistance-like MFS transporter
MGFLQMTLAALVGIAIGHATGRDGLPMAVAVLLTTLGALAAFRLLVRPQGAR